MKPPESKRQRRARELEAAGWERISLDLWRNPNGDDPSRFYSLAAAHLSLRGSA